MDNDLQKAAQKVLSGPEGQRLKAREGDIRRIAASAEGEQVKAMLQKSGFEDAVRRGDTQALREAVSGALNTRSGEQLLRQLRELMNK